MLGLCQHIHCAKVLAAGDHSSHRQICGKIKTRLFFAAAPKRQRGDVSAEASAQLVQMKCTLNKRKAREVVETVTLLKLCSKSSSGVPQLVPKAVCQVFFSTWGILEKVTSWTVNSYLMTTLHGHYYDVNNKK